MIDYKNSIVIKCMGWALRSVTIRHIKKILFNSDVINEINFFFFVRNILSSKKGR